MKISAIVPVYNTEKLVCRCIDSVLAQSFPDWELILIDDGSTDGSLDVLKSYEKKDSRIKVIHQENAGPGLARNRGIKEASGIYIVFIDSDDVIKPYYFEKLSHETADVVFIDIDQVDENFNVLHEEHMSDYQSLSKDDLLRGQMTGKILWGGVRKAVKRELLNRNGIEFTEHKVGEEAIYSFLLIYYAINFSFIEGTVYEYVNRAGSQSDTKDDDPWGSVAITLKEKVRKMGLYEQYADTINAFLATATIVALDKMAGKYSGKDYRTIANERIDKFNSQLDEKYSVDMKHMPNKAKILYPFLCMKMTGVIGIASRLKRMSRSRIPVNTHNNMVER